LIFGTALATSELQFLSPENPILSTGEKPNMTGVSIIAG